MGRTRRGRRQGDWPEPFGPSARGATLSVVTAIVKPDFKVELRIQPVNED